MSSAAAQEIRIVLSSWQIFLMAIDLAAGGGADDGQDLLFLDQLLGEGDGVLGLAGRVLDDELELAAVDAAGGVDLVDEHLGGLGLGRAEECRRAGYGENGADLDGGRGGFLAVCGQAKGQDDGDTEDQHKSSSHGRSPFTAS